MIPRGGLAQAIGQGPLLLDGGLATELERHGHDLRSSLWSARLLADDPESILDAHRAFFAAGARVATTASYQASVEGFGAAGRTLAEAERLITRSVELARRARYEQTDGQDRWVAGSVGPFGAARADGSEYSGRYGLSVAALRRWHRPRIQVLAEAGPDLLALETIPCLAEVEALLEEIAGTGISCWLSLTCEGVSTRAGEPAREAFGLASGIAEVVAVGVNCTAPGDAGRLVPLAAEASGKPVVVYPNSGEGWDAERRCWTGSATFDPRAVGGWIEDGARLIGGCCRVGPAEISSIARVLERAVREESGVGGRSAPGSKVEYGRTAEVAVAQVPQRS